MIKSGKIFFVIVLMIFAVNTSFSQNLPQQADPLKANLTLSESDKDVKDRTATGTDNRQTGSRIPKGAGKPGGEGTRLPLHWRIPFSAVSRMEILHWGLTGDLSIQSYRQAFYYQMTIFPIFR